MKTEFYTILILTILVERKILIPGWFFLVFTAVPTVFCKIFLFISPEAEFKEFELLRLRLKFKPRLKYSWFHLKLY